MEKEKRSYFAIIPGDVRYDENLTPNAKLLYGEITALCNEKGFCWASNSYFANLYGVKNNAITNWVTQLKESNYIQVEYRYKQGSKQIESRLIKLSDRCSQKDRGVVTEECGGVHKKIGRCSQKGEDNNTFNNTINNTNDINNNYNNNIKQSTFVKVEKEFGRPLSPIEIETLNYWDKDYTSDMIDLALRESVLNGVYNLKYIESILISWEKNNLKTKSEINNHLDKRRKTKSSVGEDIEKKEIPKVPLYNWLEPNDES